jgi:hypothetical protein
MDLLTRAELDALLAEHEDLCASIYMPAYRAGRETLQNPTQFKKLLTEVEEQLVAQGLRAPVAREWLEPARTLIEDQHFWQHQSEGLAAFISADLFQIYRLPLKFDDLAIVSPHFYIKPLLPLLSGDGTFYILTLSKRQVRFLQGSHFNITEIALEGTEVPESMAEALQYDETPERGSQFHTITQRGRGERTAMFHGHSEDRDDEIQDIRRYLQQVDKGLPALLQDRQAPLILAGVEELLSAYREVNTYPHLVEEEIRGNVEHLKSEELHETAWPLIQPYFDRPRQEALNLYHDLSDTDLVSSDIRTIIPAAHYGRVNTLFINIAHQLWGTFDLDSESVNLRGEAEAGDKDLIDTIAAKTLINGGAVFSVGPEDAPNSGPVAAIFRYSLSGQGGPPNEGSSS